MPRLQVLTTEKASEAVPALANGATQHEWVKGMKQLVVSPHICTAGGSGFSLWARFYPVPWSKSCPLACVIKLSTVQVTALGSHVLPWVGALLEHECPIRASRMVSPKEVCCDCTKIAPMCRKLENWGNPFKKAQL